MIMPAEHATIYDVATRAGVSISTVSHTLNRPQRVHEATRQRVLDAIDELGYVPKATAMAHARKAVGRVGVIAPFSSYESYTRRLKGILQEARTDATEIVIYDQESAASASSPLLSALPVTRRLDGVVIMGVPLDDRLADRLSPKACRPCWSTAIARNSTRSSSTTTPPATSWERTLSSAAGSRSHMSPRRSGQTPICRRASYDETVSGVPSPKAVSNPIGSSIATRPTTSPAVAPP